MTDNIDNKQLPLTFSTPNYMGREDFMVSECNREAFMMIDSWPSWLSFGVLIYGPKGSGKSHLAHLFADKISTFLQKPVRVPLLNAKEITVNKVKKIYSEYQYIIVEDISPTADEEALFHLFNLYDTPEHYVLWTAETSPHQMQFKLRDLQSRLNMLPAIAITEPDDFMLQMLIVKLFNDRQLVISPDILNYIIKNTRRSFAYVQSLVAEIDYLSLAWQKAVNYNMIKTAIDNLQQKEDKQLDLFDE
ncbi:MAG: hypothetical protein ILA52_01580 [Alphaproteobacteria bacterium]|nr:hypothetical protein [Alphaproteobacteria bacterium]